MAKGIKTGGRKKGTPNKITALLKDAIVQAAEEVGQDTQGKDGTVGYLKWLAVEYPQAFATLIGRVIPTQLEGTGDDGEIQITVKRFVLDE